MTMKSIVAFAMLLALGVTAVGMYMDTKPPVQRLHALVNALTC